MQVHASQLNDSLESGVYNLFGEDLYWIDYALNKFIALIGKDSLSLHIFDKGDTFNEAVGSLYAVSFTDERAVVIVKEDLLGDNSKNHKMLEEALESGIEPNFLVMLNAKLDAKEKKLVNTINCTKLKEYECVKIAQDFFTYGIEREALNTLARYTDSDLVRMKNESEKLLSYALNKKVTLADVENLVSEEADVQMFNFVNSLVTGNNSLALKQLDKLKKRGESNSSMLAMLVNQFRRMLHASLSKKSDEELSEIFKVKPYAITKARENRFFSVPKLKAAVEMLVGYELKFKSGEMTEQLAFDSAVARLIGKEVN